jgi:TPR repeat protein
LFARLAAVATEHEATGIALSASRRARWLGAKPTSNDSNAKGDQPPDRTAGGEADFVRGEALRKGDEGAEKNFVEALACYRRAAELGHLGAMHRIGVMYARGEGVSKDDVKAVEWYRKAAEAGFAEAQYDLGVRYILGLGVRKDEPTGLEWYRRAAAQGWQEAIDALRQRESSGRHK